MRFASKEAVFNNERSAVKVLLRAVTFHVEDWSATGLEVDCRFGHSDRRSSFVGLLQGDHKGVSAKINPASVVPTEVPRSQH